MLLRQIVPFRGIRLKSFCTTCRPVLGCAYGNIPAKPFGAKRRGNYYANEIGSISIYQMGLCLKYDTGAEYLRLLAFCSVYSLA